MSVVIVSLFLTGARFMLCCPAWTEPLWTQSQSLVSLRPRAPAFALQRHWLLTVRGLWGVQLVGQRQTEEQHARPTEEDPARNDALANLRLVDDAPRI